jgi:hypothetical protein
VGGASDASRARKRAKAGPFQASSTPAWARPSCRRSGGADHAAGHEEASIGDVDPAPRPGAARSVGRLRQTIERRQAEGHPAHRGALPRLSKDIGDELGPLVLEALGADELAKGLIAFRE